jgi:hypothetical protein
VGMAEYFTPKQLAQQYAAGLSERSILEAIKSRNHPLPHFRLNRKTIMIRRTDFDQWISAYRIDDQGVDAVVQEIWEGLAKGRTHSATTKRVHMVKPKPKKLR